MRPFKKWDPVSGHARNGYRQSDFSLRKLRRANSSAKCQHRPLLDPQRGSTFFWLSSGFPTASCSLIFKIFPLASCTFMVSGNSNSPGKGGIAAVCVSSSCQAPAWMRSPRIARTCLAVLSTTVIVMGAVILYLSTIRQSRSSPAYTFKSQEVISVNPGRMIVKSSMARSFLTLLPVGAEHSHSKVYDQFCRHGSFVRRPTAKTFLTAGD